MRRRTTRTVAATSALLAGAGLLGACSTDSGSTDLVADAQATATVTVAPSTPVNPTEAAYEALPTLPDQTVTVEGIDNGLTNFERLAFNTDTGGENDTDTIVDRKVSDTDLAFQRLCSGQIDVVDSYTTLTQAQYDACAANGLDLVQIEVAANALVVAIKNETDVGGDCVSLEQLAEIYRAGSPVTSWAQVGDNFDDVDLTALGAPYGDSRFTWFGQAVLDTTNPARVTVRSDYVSYDTDRETRLSIVGNDRDERLASQERTYTRQRQQLATYIKQQTGVVRDARAELRTARFEVKKGIRTGRDAETRAADRARLAEAKRSLAKAEASLLSLKAQERTAARQLTVSKAAQKRIDALTGRVGYFGFSYYQVFENELRPFEVTLDGTENCVFPSPVTITSGEYPLSRPYLLTTTQRSLEREEVQDFLLYYLDNAKADLQTTQQNTGLDEAGQLVVVTDDQIATQRRWVTGREEPEYLELEGDTVTTGSGSGSGDGAAADATSSATTTASPSATATGSAGQ
ncbi:PstS family phosphate ABC transporter substrate-binding protein [Nocardioides bruguierae]|uniref:PBP domain-containing protein n=1 Tax=Nocardioides bruguierae TaxID=2945102 RepID=A0A9X2D7I9_9ACTN|nr:substrate-binding domain-containing protein [Nocardioides bruguierae]MCM0620790.1 hypothetical protein [Nocardioides bruguierae]